MNNNKPSVESTYKSQDTEEWLDVVFTRKVGFQFARLFARLDWHPNTVTIISMILGVIAGFFFYNRADTPQGLILNAIGVLLMVIANFLDSADGQLARMTGKMTSLGRILDGSSADIMFICIYINLASRLQDQTIPLTECRWGVWAYLMAAFSGFMCHGRHCGLADYYRNIHLFFIKEKTFDQFDTYEGQLLLYHSKTWRQAPAWKFFMWFYVRWTKSQESQTPQFQRLIHQVRLTGITPEFRSEFRRRSLPMMKWTNILTFNTRAIALYIGCLTDMPWLYLLFEILVLNAIYWHMRLSHEHFCHTMHDEYRMA